MRIVIDMQGAETASRFRGIGSVTRELTKAIIRNKNGHEILLALNGTFSDAIADIREDFKDLLPNENIRIWYAPTPTPALDPANSQRILIAEKIREAFIASLFPDIVLIPSLFEGWGDNAITSIGDFDKITPVAVILYDLIPFVLPDSVTGGALYKRYYHKKIEHLKKSSVLLSISEYSKKEAIENLKIEKNKIHTISLAHDSFFFKKGNSDKDIKDTCGIGITKPFILHVGGGDANKNHSRLIEAYSKLPGNLRGSYQLVFAGDMPQEIIDDFYLAAKVFGVSKKELIITGYLDKEKLLALYHNCALFVFPSLWEGFGLPALEAMACGVPVIASNTTSLPEVIGREDMLFDPYSVSSIKDKIEKALTDGSFRKEISEYGIERAKLFSWDKSAQKAIKVLEQLKPEAEPQEKVVVEKAGIFKPQYKKILLLKLDHMGDLLLALPAISKLKARYPNSKIDIVVGNWNLELAESAKLLNKIYIYDFFKKESHIQPNIETEELASLLKKLPIYDLAIDLRRQRDTRFILAKVRAAVKVGYETFDACIDSFIDIKLPSFSDVPFETTPLNKTHISKQILTLIDAIPNDFNDYIEFSQIGKLQPQKKGVIALFPNAGNNVKEWGSVNFSELLFLLSAEKSIKIVNIYLKSEEEALKLQIPPDNKFNKYINLSFNDLIYSLSEASLSISNNSFGAHISSYLNIAVIAIYSGHETVEEWFPPFGENIYIFSTKTQCLPCHISNKEKCIDNFSCLRNITAEFVFRKIMEFVDNGKILETFPKFERLEDITSNLLYSIAEGCSGNISDKLKLSIANCMEATFLPSERKKQLLIDISELHRKDVKTGIQRVVRNILYNILIAPPNDYEVTPIYFSSERGEYFYAKRFIKRFVGETPMKNHYDPPLCARAGDVFLGLDLHLTDFDVYSAKIREMRRQGVKQCFLVYDLIPENFPRYSENSVVNLFNKWLSLVADGDMAVCISKNTADDLLNWLQDCSPHRFSSLQINWFHLAVGEVANKNVNEIILSKKEKEILQKIVSKPSFLMVGTLEPRKGHRQALAAFEKLWEQGLETNLVIVGKMGWLVEDLAKEIDNHKELGHRLFWLKGIGDGFLSELYKANSCLIAASKAEGFGLPLVEAAKHRLPIIARDIPVFREVAGNYAYYFSGIMSEDLSEAIIKWLELYKEDNHPKSDKMKILTWKESTKNLLDILINEERKHL